MSYDLHVIARKQPKASDLSAFLGARDDLEAEGQLKRNGYVLLTGTDGTHAEVDGPSRMGAEDVPDAANGSGEGVGHREEP